MKSGRGGLIGRSDLVSREAFVYDGDQVLARFNSQGQITNRYLWGPTVDMLLADEQVGEELLWAACDHQNSVRDLVKFDAATSRPLRFRKWWRTPRRPTCC